MYADPSSDTRDQVVLTYAGHPSFSCFKCATVIALQDEMISKAFTGRDGPGYLLNSATNVKLGAKEDRSLLTGVHSIANVYCLGCNTCIGWYYHKASESSQKYKEGKFMLERERLVKDNAWKLDD